MRAHAVHHQFNAAELTDMPTRRLAVARDAPQCAACFGLHAQIPWMQAHRTDDNINAAALEDDPTICLTVRREIGERPAALRLHALMAATSAHRRYDIVDDPTLHEQLARDLIGCCHVQDDPAGLLL